jgi:hypothetical protein
MLLYTAKKEGNIVERDFTIELTSNDNYILNMPKSYKLYRASTQKENKLLNGFKNSILGMDIGINSEGFSYIAILATLLAVASLIIMYILFRVN